jgi:hypothetical protein
VLLAFQDSLNAAGGNLSESSWAVGVGFGSSF